MIKLNEYDFELSTINKDPEFGYKPEFREYKMISGKIRRDTIGHRFVAKIGYAYLTDVEIGYLVALLQAQKTTGSITAEITTPHEGTFTGSVFLEVNESQKRFAYDSVLERWIWLNWEIILTGTEVEAL